MLSNTFGLLKSFILCIETLMPRIQDPQLSAIELITSSLRRFNADDLKCALLRALSCFPGEADANSVQIRPSLAGSSLPRGMCRQLESLLEDQAQTPEVCEATLE